MTDHWTRFTQEGMIIISIPLDRMEKKKKQQNGKIKNKK